MRPESNVVELSNEGQHLRRLFDDQRKAADESPFPTLAERQDMLRRVGEMLDDFEGVFKKAIAADFGQRAGI